MCNAIQEIIFNMYRKGYSVEQIADVAEKSVDDVKNIINKKKKS